MSGGGGGDNEIPETAEEKELAKIASERWERYQDVFVPLENQYMEEVDQLGTEQARGEVTGQATTAVQQGMGGMAMNPNRGDQGMGAALGTARSGASTRAATGLRGQEIQGKQGLVSIGQGQSADAIQSMGQIAGQAASEAAADTQREAFRDFNRRQAWGEVAGNVAGAGAASYMGNQGSGVAGRQQRQGLARQNQGNDFFQRGTNDALRSNRGGY